MKVTVEISCLIEHAWIGEVEAANDEEAMLIAKAMLIGGRMKMKRTREPEAVRARIVESSGNRATLYIRVPPSLKTQVERVAEAEGLSVNAWAISAFKDRLARQALAAEVVNEALRRK